VGCVQTQRAWRRRDGQGITFRFNEGFSDQPIEFKCGKCLGCRRVKAQAWALRIVHEAQMHERNCFLTLTIDEENMPEDRSLDVRHWQLFAKRLRQKAGPFRHFYSGEYGEKYDRPHYHACIFGLDMRIGACIFSGDGSSPLWRSPILDDIWGMGHVAIGELEYGSAQYTAKYLVKSQREQDLDSKMGTRKAEYISMSRRPGIGASWINEYKWDAFSDNYLTHQGKRHAVPKYYEKVLTDGELEAWKDKTQVQLRKWIDSGEGTWERRETKERILEIQKKKKDRKKELINENF